MFTYRLERLLAFFILVVIGALFGFSSSLKVPEAFDFYVHVGFFMLFSFVTLRFYHHYSAWVGLFLFAFCAEFIQLLSASRTFSFEDGLGNVIGVGFTFCLFFIFKQLKRS